jgi:hypothetical protein
MCLHNRFARGLVGHQASGEAVIFRDIPTASQPHQWPPTTAWQRYVFEILETRIARTCSSPRRQSDLSICAIQRNERGRKGRVWDHLPSRVYQFPLPISSKLDRHNGSSKVNQLVLQPQFGLSVQFPFEPCQLRLHHRKITDW